ncbi:citrate lyase holo-[acyl-carrier protein] synthase [Citrobacter sp. RHB25-C09]|uniref:citrate lyase holo-[acyl-carrier protein] synthase n=1 Tax=Citrobacter sp. RHB25-C09 TaxID=2742624 RepID=UPI0015EE96A0|nr:citrate lyase holo-[acyl-carrier protein] synthase [Citrobacter sp. RHB25-C09]QMI04027.1 citrate lyase holo-[acyl-carrier protein] synthase [Citrobacter sp. RHB25-C09]
MTGADLLSGGQCVSLEEILQAREKRVARQRHALACYRLPLISLTLVAPGPIKNTPAWRRVADLARAEIVACCERNQWVCVWETTTAARSGPEWMAALCAPAKQLKQAMLLLEDEHPLGRLWDIDVIDCDGSVISRSALGKASRPCLICNEDAHVCARARRHEPDLLLEEIAKRIERYERNDRD